MMSGSSTIAPTRMRGLSDEYGSWKTICMSRRAWRIRARENASTSSPVEPDLAGRRLDQPQDAAAGRRLAAAGFADEAERLASSIVKLTSSTARTIVRRRKQPALAAEVLDEVADLEERHQRRASRIDRRRAVEVARGVTGMRTGIRDRRSQPVAGCASTRLEPIADSAARTRSPDGSIAERRAPLPWIACKPLPGAPPGIDASRPRVYGMLRIARRARDRGLLDDAARRT